MPDGLVLALILIGLLGVALLTLFRRKLFPSGEPPEDLR